MIYHIIFGLGSLVLYYALYGSELVPRFISVSGLVAATALMIGLVLGNMDVFGELSGVASEALFALPIAVVEVTLAM